MILRAVVESARLDWAAGHGRFTEAAQDPGRADVLHRQLAAVTEHLRRRLGDVFTLAELADAYLGAERWAAIAIDEQAPAPGSDRDLAFVTDAAFQLTSRHAVDYVP
ncbi:MAG: hypothetical protein OEW31_00385 [Thermoleophilia bacterium]|nr:hypothetical protein [Thermoleophilia bacterium]MDH4344770.1 hypothetical protein [Thermoleophilia bacterium]MDH5332880.1 hypothetical protein [Thermoleophilia bacterium]